MTPQAQNALLKTLEEPPEYVVIMLLTTSKTAMLSTVISRCVQLDMRPVQDEVIRKLNVTSVNGRQRIWECTVRLITGNPRNALVGVTPYRIASILGSMLQWEIDVYTHNQILEVGADTGIPAMLIFLVFLLLLAGKSLKLGLAPAKAEEWKQKLPLLILLFLIIANVMEATLLFYGYLSGGVFMLLCGWICERYVRFRISKKMISGED